MYFDLGFTYVTTDVVMTSFIHVPDSGEGLHGFAFSYSDVFNLPRGAILGGTVAFKTQTVEEHLTRCSAIGGIPAR